MFPLEQYSSTKRTIKKLTGSTIVCPIFSFGLTGIILLKKKTVCALNPIKLFINNRSSSTDPQKNHFPRTFEQFDYGLDCTNKAWNLSKNCAFSATAAVVFCYTFYWCCFCRGTSEIQFCKRIIDNIRTGSGLVHTTKSTVYEQTSLRVVLAYR